MTWLRLLVFATGLSLGWSVGAASFDYRFYFMGSGSDALVDSPTTAYLFALSDAQLVDAYVRAIASGSVGSLDAYASGRVDRWTSYPFMDFVSEGAVSENDFLWVVVQGDAYQTGVVRAGGSGGPAERLVGFEDDPNSGTRKDFMSFWTADAIALQPMSSVPEPSSSLLVLAGLALLGLRRKG